MIFLLVTDFIWHDQHHSYYLGRVSFNVLRDHVGKQSNTPLSRTSFNCPCSYLMSQSASYVYAETSTAPLGRPSRHPRWNAMRRQPKHHAPKKAAIATIHLSRKCNLLYRKDITVQSGSSEIRRISNSACRAERSCSTNPRPKPYPRTWRNNGRRQNSQSPKGLKVDQYWQHVRSTGD